MKKALLLGAGFSYELGLPIANTLTEDFYCYLNRNRLEKLISRLSINQPYGKDRPIDPSTFKEIKDIFILAQKEKKNYEDLMAELLKTSHAKKQPEIDTFNYFNSVLVGIISQILWIHQEENYQNFQKNKEFYRLIHNYLDDGDVFVFTLNHDICFELLCIDYKIPFSFGAMKVKEYGQTNLNPKLRLSFLGQLREKYATLEFSFPTNEKPKFNIIKLHGAFNEYTEGDEENLLFVSPENCVASLDYLNKVKKTWLETEYIVNGQNARMSESIPVTDDNGAFQILWKTLLIGGKKYSITINPKPGEEKLQVLDNVLNQVNELTIIGYGFNDKHINSRIYNSMILNPDLKVRRIDPIDFSFPEQFDAVNYNSRVTGGKCTTTQWLYYRVFEKWESDKTGSMKEFLDTRSKLELEFRRKYFK